MAHSHCSIEDADPFPQGIDCPIAEDGCSCPLCPEERSLRPDALPIWFPDEPICSRRDCRHIPWVHNQKRIARVGAPLDRYFTVEMLEVVAQVRKGIAGVSPDQPISQAREAEATWIADHKTPRVVRGRNKSPP